MCGICLGEPTHSFTRVLVFALIVAECCETEQRIGLSRFDGQGTRIGFLRGGHVSPPLIQLRQAEVGLDVRRIGGDRAGQGQLGFSRFALQQIQAG
jgi:hypothetical protein